MPVTLNLLITETDDNSKQNAGCKTIDVASSFFLIFAHQITKIEDFVGACDNALNAHSAAHHINLLPQPHYENNM